MLCRDDLDVCLDLYLTCMCCEDFDDGYVSVCVALTPAFAHPCFFCVSTFEQGPSLK